MFNNAALLNVLYEADKGLISLILVVHAYGQIEIATMS